MDVPVAWVCCDGTTSCPPNPLWLRLTDRVHSQVLVCVLDPYVLLAVAPCVVVLVWVRQYNVKTSREVKRIEGMCRSPVYAHLTNTTDGLAVLRAYPGATQRCVLVW